MTTVLCTCNDVGIPTIATGVSSIPVSCQDNNLVVPECEIGPLTKPIGNARLDQDTVTLLNAAPLPLTPGNNVSPVDPAVQRWAATATDLSWTNDMGCQVGIAIGYDATVIAKTNIGVSHYRFYIGSEVQVNGGATQVHATVQVRTIRSTVPQHMVHDVSVSANPLGNASNEKLPFVTVPVGGTLLVHMYGYHTLEPDDATYPAVTTDPQDAALLITATARVWAVTGWV